MARTPKTVEQDTVRLDEIKQGDRVRLLLPLFDNVQRIPEGTVIIWPFDHPPTADQACREDEKVTPLTAPPMTDGKPPADYVDPTTGEKPVIPST